MPTFSLAQKHAELDQHNAALLVRLAQEAPSGVPMRPPKPDGRNAKAMRGFPIVGTKELLARAAAGIGPTDPWKRARERDYATRSGQNSTCTLSLDQILTLSNGRCYLCQIPLTPLTMYIDHIIPLALGGTHTDDNVAAACLPCNSGKGARIVAFMARTRKPIYQRA